MIKYLYIADTLVNYGCSIENLTTVVKGLSTIDIERYAYSIKRIKNIRKKQIDYTFLMHYLSLHGFYKTIVVLGKEYDINLIMSYLIQNNSVPEIDINTIKDDIVMLYTEYNLTLRHISGLLAYQAGNTPDHSHLRKLLVKYGVKTKSKYKRIPKIITDSKVILCIKFIQFFKLEATPENFKNLCCRFNSIEHKGLIAEALINRDNYQIKQCTSCKTMFVGVQYYCKACAKKINRMNVV